MDSTAHLSTPISRTTGTFRGSETISVDATVEKATEWWSLEQQPVAYYRAAAARAQRLQAEATTPRLKKYLGEVIARCERLAGEVESASGKDFAETAHLDPA